MDPNPYDSPNHAGDEPPARPPAMTWPKGIAIVAATTLLGAAGGTGVGVALGTFVPGYYRSVFFGGRDPEFDPVAVGIGQGLTQGLALGLIAGLVVVAGIAWFKLRAARRDKKPSQ